MKLFNKHSGTTINVSTEAIVRAIVLVIVAVFAMRFIGNVGHQLELIAIAIFMALALNPAVTWLSTRLHLKSRIWATGLAYLTVLALLIAFVALVVPPLVRQTNAFIKTVPDSISQLKDENSTPAKFVQKYHLEKQIDDISHEAQSRLNDAPHVVFSAAGRVGGVIISIITIIVLTFMMLVEGPLWYQRLFALMPDEKRAPYKKLAHQMYRVVTGYVNGQVVIAAIASFFALSALLIATNILNVSINVVALAGIVFMFGLIPLIGNTIAAVLVCIICLFVSTPLAIIMAVYFPIYQQIENSTLQPHIQAKNNQLTPLLVFIAALLGAGFGGLLGAFVAIPLAGCLRILFEYKFGDTLVPTKDEVDAAQE